MNPPPRAHAFTLMEILVVITIIAVLAAIAFPAIDAVRLRGQQTAGLSNIRQVGAATLLYAGEHNFQLPGYTSGKPGHDRWPKVLSQYLKDVRAYALPGDPNNYIARKADPLSNTRNNTSFIMNGYNDLGAFGKADVQVTMLRIEYPATTLLLGTPKPSSTHFFMDFLEPPHGNNKDLLNLRSYGDGSNYMFADGSARFIAEKDYDDKLWLVDKTFTIPNL